MYKKNRTPIPFMLIAFLLIVFFSCEFAFDSGFNQILIDKQWKLSFMKFSNKSEIDFEEQSKLLFDQIVSSFQFDSDNSYESKTEVYIMGELVSETSSGTWSYNSNTNFFMMDSDTFTVISFSDKIIELEMSQHKSDSLLSMNYPQHVGSKVVLVLVPIDDNNEPKDDDVESNFRLTKKTNQSADYSSEHIYSYEGSRLVKIDITQSSEHTPQTEERYFYKGDTVTHTYYVPTWVDGTIIPVEKTNIFVFNNGKLNYFRGNQIKEYAYNSGLLTHCRTLDDNGNVKTSRTWTYNDQHVLVSSTYGSTEYTYHYETNRIIEKEISDGQNRYTTYWLFENGKRVKMYDEQLINGSWSQSPYETLYEYNEHGLLSKMTKIVHGSKDYTNYEYEEIPGNYRDFDFPENKFFWKHP